MTESKMFRFVHAADLHLDSPLRGLDDSAPVETIRSAPRVALRNLIDFCLEVRADLLVLAGDNYDGDCKDGSTGAYLAAQLRRLAPTPVVLIRGNHDARSVITNFLTMPPNVTVLDGPPAMVEFQTLRIAVHGSSFADRHVKENVALDYPKPLAGRFNIGLLHTSLSDAGDHEPYAPCTEDQLQRHGYDYWALGHIHTRRVVRERGPAIVYPGNLQGRHARECGAKGAYLATVNDQLELTGLAFHALDSVRWERIEMTVDPEHSAESVLAATAEHAGPLQDAAGDRPLVLRIVLTGPSRAHEMFQADPQIWRERMAEHVRNAAPEAWLEDVRFRTSPRHEAFDETWGDIGDELAAALEGLRADPAALQAIIDGPLDDLVKKVNPLLNDGPEPQRLRDPAWLAEHLDRVLPTLRTAVGGAS